MKYIHFLRISSDERITHPHWKDGRSGRRHQMEISSALLALCAGNSRVTGEFPSHRTVMRSLGVFFDLLLNNPLSKQSWGWWFEMPSRSLWRHGNTPIVLPSSCRGSEQLIHWGRVTHICVSTLTIIGLDNGLSPGRRQAIIRTNSGILLIEPLGTNFSEILSKIHTFSLKKMHFKMSSGKWRPFFSASMC